MERAIDRESLARYLSAVVGTCRIEGIEPLGSGAHGTGYLVRLSTEGGGARELVLKGVGNEGLGHEYPSDRAAMFLLARETFGTIPGHVRAIEVLGMDERGEVRPVGGSVEYFLLMERAHGVSYFADLDAMAGEAHIGGAVAEKIRAMTGYLATLHERKRTSRSLYLRKIRDTIGHGECLMGVFDSYPEGVMSASEMASIECACIEWRARLRDRTHRLCEIHGDFHPGNIWFPEGCLTEEDCREGLCLLDRSRGPWGEPADDLTALTINYVFWGILKNGGVTGAYREALELFYEEYIGRTGDMEILEVVAPFYAFRGAVVANPLFYPRVTPEQREAVFRFVRGVLAAPRFDPSVA